ncbi:glycosyltransferase [Glycomyces sp. L485]|uniref:glycosyltransferase n=1 Tax=Glycomyces sp. L485 TaxID=2909235 RepID=UPI001F4AFAEC|nr:glycosyltransferase [Glycomyces sp. L485]MCH7231396.1 glycosyltransferase [Glycomyces sp. L485]
MRITFLMTEMNGLGGTARATLALADGLMRRGDDVEIISVFNSPTRTDLSISEHLRFRVITRVAMSGDKTTPKLPGWDRPAKVIPLREELYKRFNGYVEDEVARVLSELETDVVISTRTGLAAYIAEFAPADMVKICQIHEDPGSHNKQLNEQMRGVYERMDAIEVLTEYARQGLARNAPESSEKIHVLPNAIVDTLAEPLPDGTKLAVAVGRLAPIKQYDLLIEAFASLAAEFPDWRLRIFGRGPESGSLRRQVDRLSLHDRILVPGPAIPAFAEWAKADIGVSSSRVESFGVSIVEAMSMGVPVVSTDVHSGPPEIITSGVDGLLVEADAASLADGLRRLMADADLRKTLGANAIKKAKQYSSDELARRHSELFDSLVATGQSTLRAAPEEALRLTAERVDTEAVEVVVHGTRRPPLVLRSVSTGTQLRPERTGGGLTFDRYRVDLAMLRSDIRTEDWEAITPPRTNRLDCIGTAALLDAELRSASDLLPQSVDSRLVLRSRTRQRFGEVRTIRRADRRLIVLEVDIVGTTVGEAALDLVSRANKQSAAQVSGTALSDGRFEFELHSETLGECLRQGTSSLTPWIATGGPTVRVGSLRCDMSGRRTMGVFELEAEAGTFWCEWGYERSGALALELQS